MFFTHPDDETLAAGATLRKLATLGADIHVAIPATGVHSRRSFLGEGEREAALVTSC
ncbi:PIG-L family deacetylase [Chrysiogenes arsenatis]|uniref:PIG-L family deacetylase n=1 Tax=Chrysiogenes arsenatis TaxID=309797 RepID=UPI0009FBE86B